MTNIARKQKNILLVEDDFILAMDAEDAIRSAGLEVSVVDNVDDALKVLESEKIDGAIMDFNLGNQTSEPVLGVLDDKEIPFAVVSGADLKELTTSVGEIKHLYRKPVDYDQVALHLAELTRTRSNKT